tara:strand:- start:368 stop:544 length:177 start_codon:yes stop_codon:yes gene_type:complete
MKRPFKITSQEISFSEIKEEILAMSIVWGCEVEELSSEEFPFENFNNMISDKGIILFK